MKNPSYTYKHGVIKFYISILIPWYKPCITTSNVNQAKVLWIRDVQKDILTSFNYQNLQHHLGLYNDDTKLLHCGGRLKNANIPYEPMDRFTYLVIVFYHCVVKHNGTRDTLNTLRSEYWIPERRSYVNKILRQCRVC